MAFAPDLRYSTPKSRFLILMFAVLTAFVCSCKRTVVVSKPEEGAGKAKEEMMSAQEIAVRQELESIAAFLQRSKMEMLQSGSGLYYRIERGSDPKAPCVERGNAVRLAYTLRLLNGEQVACSEKNGLKTFIVGKSEVESGLTEAVLMMRKGDKAQLIIPSHLGFGFSGNGNDIPPMSTLLYEISVAEVLISPEEITKN